VAPASPSVVYLTGSNFASGSTILIDGSPVSSTFIDLTHMTLVTPLLPSNDEHDAIVTVRRPDLFSGSNDHILHFENHPVLSSISSALDHVVFPPTSSYIQGGVALELAGFFFKKGSSIRVDLTGSSSLSTQVIWESSQSLNATSPGVATTGVYNLYVRSPSGLESNPLPITYIYHPPTLTTLLPSTGATDGGDGVLLQGTFFLSGAAVTVDSISVPVTFIDSTQLSITTLAHMVATVPVEVTNPDGQNSNILTFKYVFGLPRIINITPVLDSTGSLVQVSGKYYTSPNITSMWLSPTGAMTPQYNIPEFTIISNTSATFIMPLVPVGDYNLYLSSTSGIGTNPTATIQYRNSPIITSVVPSSGGTAGNYTVDLLGSNFSTGTVWTWAGSTISATFLTSGHVQVTAPAHVTGVVPITATNQGIFSGSSTFTYIQTSGALTGTNWMPSVST